jgi:hypothetical protein
LIITAPILIEGNNAIIKNNSGNWTFDINGTFLGVEIRNLSIKGISDFDKGIQTNVKQTRLYNIKFFDIEEIISTTSNYEIIADKIYAWSQSKLRNIGLKVASTDSHFTDIIMRNYTIPMNIKSGGNVFTNIHPWIDIGFDNSQSICILSEGGVNRFKSCCFDGYKTIIKVTTAWSFMILSDCLITYSPYTWTSGIGYGADFLINNGISYPSISVNGCQFYGPITGLVINIIGWDVIHSTSNAFKTNVSGNMFLQPTLTLNSNFVQTSKKYYLSDRTYMDLELSYNTYTSSAGWKTIGYLGMSPSTTTYRIAVSIKPDGTVEIIPIKFDASTYELSGYFPLVSPSETRTLYINVSY